MANKDIKKETLNDSDLADITSGCSTLSDARAVALLKGFDKNKTISDIMHIANPELVEFLGSLNPSMTIGETTKFLSRNLKNTTKPKSTGNIDIGSITGIK